MLKEFPKVSVIIPLYNRAIYLPQAIDSILLQDYENYEIIIVDDGSTENITPIIEECIKKSPLKIRVLKQRNKGPGGARNKGIGEASGEYIAFLDADDEWEKGFLPKTVQGLASGHYQWVKTMAFRTIINENEECIERTVIQEDILTNNFYADLLKKNLIGSPSKVVIEKKCFEQVGGFREDLRIREDWEMWLRLAKADFKLCHIPEPLYQYKIRQNSLTKTESSKSYKCSYRVLCDYKRDAFKIDPANRVLYAEQMWNLARHILNSKEKDLFLFCKCVIKSQLYSPSLIRLLKSLKSLIKKHT